MLPKTAAPHSGHSQSPGRLRPRLLSGPQSPPPPQPCMAMGKGESPAAMRDGMRSGDTWGTTKAPLTLVRLSGVAPGEMREKANAAETAGATSAPTTDRHQGSNVSTLHRVRVAASIRAAGICPLPFSRALPASFLRSFLWVGAVQGLPGLSGRQVRKFVLGLSWDSIPATPGLVEGTS